MIYIIGIHVEGRIVFTPGFQDGVGRNGRVEHPLGDIYTLHVCVGWCCIVSAVDPPGTEATVTIEDIAIDFKTCQVLLGNGP